MVGLVRERAADLDGAASAASSGRSSSTPAYAEAGLALDRACTSSAASHERSRELALAAHASALPSEGLDPTTRGKLANLHAALGDAYREVGELREAIDAYRKALDRCPGFHDIRQRLGVALREAGLPARAIAELQRVLRANPSYLDARGAARPHLLHARPHGPREARAEWAAALERDAPRDDAPHVRSRADTPGAPAEADDGPGRSRTPTEVGRRASPRRPAARQPPGRLVQVGAELAGLVALLFELVAQQVAHRDHADHAPVRRATGRWRQPARFILSSHSSTRSRTCAVTTSRVMTAETGVVGGSRRATTTRRHEVALREDPDELRRPRGRRRRRRARSFMRRATSSALSCGCALTTPRVRITCARTCMGVSFSCPCRRCLEPLPIRRSRP